MQSNILQWLQLILQERFGHKFLLQKVNDGLALSLDENPNPQIYFPQLNPLFLEASSNGPCSIWDPTLEKWASILGQPIPCPNSQNLPTPLIEEMSGGYNIHYDILGLTYWMLNRIEEIGRTDLDKHQRFPAIHSHAYNHNYLKRPIVDEWLYILGQVIQRVWPTLELKQHKFSIKVSHDVDRPSCYIFKNTISLMRIIAKDIINKKTIQSIWHAPWGKINTDIQLNRTDPYNTFDWIMDQSDKANIQSAFYFICGGTHFRYDAEYQLHQPAMRNLLNRIHTRGHEIGLHPSYRTFQSSEQIKQEFLTLRHICQEEGIVQNYWGGRMHYLRWEHPTTLQYWEDAGLSYDSTLGYADRAGFRCGTCFEYPAFNPLTQQILTLRIRPLIIMESTALCTSYTGLDVKEQILDKFLDLKAKCQLVCGNFTLLWHNSEFVDSKYLEIYSSILATN